MDEYKKLTAGYFQVTCPLPGVYRLEDPRGVYLTLLVGQERALLVDTGMGIGNAACAAAELTDLPIIAVNTHGHIDHAGGNYQFESVWLSKKDWDVLRVWLPIERKHPILEMEDTPIPPGFNSADFLGYDGDNLLELVAGQRFNLGGLTVEAVSLPTHTQGSIGFFCAELELLLTGDSLSTFVYLVFPESCTISQYLKALEQIELLPFTKMLSSHEPEVMGREHLLAFRRCAQALRPAETVRFRNPMFPEHPGNMFIYETPCCSKGYAALVYAEDKLDTVKA